MRQLHCKAYLLAYSCLVVLLAMHCQSQDCGYKTGWFGPKCQYKCHCTNNYCNTDGDCTYGSCEKGWFGPACQYADLTTTRSTTKTPRWLSDGNDNTCNDIYKPTKQPSVTFTQSFPITWLRIRVSHADYLQSIQPQLWKNNHRVNCSWESVSVNDRVKDIYCTQQVEADRVTLSGQGQDVYGLCSVYISGGRNFAINQTAVQSSTYRDGGDASRAVDGNTRSSGDWDKESCTHTSKDTYPYWTVTFTKPQMVNRYVLYNRDESSDHLKGFALTSYDSEGNAVHHHKDIDPTDRLVYNINPAPRANPSPISRVTIRIRQTESILTICEFEAYGDCARGTYGLDCEKHCDNRCVGGCAVTGNCLSCPAGYMGKNCETECPWFKYGVNCQGTCSYHCQDPQCDKKTGHCLTSCKAGYTGNRCDEECPKPSYGDGCKGRCSIRCEKQECDIVTGACKGDCMAGYKGFKCDEACQPPSYGVNCQQTCNNCQNQQCDIVTGSCRTYCKPGYKDDKCDKACSSTEYGPGCTSNCSTKCVASKCDPFSGKCNDCPAGKKGDQCDKDCPPTQHGARCKFNCSNDCLNGQCDGATGFCVDCPHGKMKSEYCDQVCMSGTRGHNCSETCSSNCGEDGSCHPENGTCVFACKEGYRGAMCTEECPPTKHGSGCLQECSNNCINNECDGVTGNCIDCPDGKKLDRLCGQDCAPGKYGKHCKESCSEFCNMDGTKPGDSPCDHVFGYCFKGCLAAYEEPRCLTLADDGSALVIGLGVGIAILVIVVIVGAVVAAYCYCRIKHRSTHAPQQGSRPGYDGVNMQNQDDHTYRVMYTSAADDYEMPRNESTTKNNVVENSPGSGPIHSADYENADVGHYEEIQEVALKENHGMNVEQEQCEESNTRKSVEETEYENCI